jgi:WD40 repeat protein
VTDRGGIHVWELSGQRGYADLGFDTNQIQSPQWSRDGRLLLTPYQGGGARLWDLKDLKKPVAQELRMLTNRIETAAFSPDGACLAVNSRTQGEIEVWRLKDARPVARLGRHSEKVNSIAFDPTGDLILSAGGDKTARLWHWASELLLTEFKGSSAPLAAASFSSDPMHVLTRTYDGEVQIHKCPECCPAKELSSLAKRRAARRFTLEERRKYLER